ncbi:centromere/kinetochore protein zw10 homolog [Lethenteron reissneri]|uniref:centromere/kinetochore protein zw10 homolog n=1 Tax=Lethenteron reissneri TaxID=7753 RepID=UPI002AB6DD3F|nr:centromere/kinetochore protein zw10 homolog [Lethenteron reissneri]
MSSFVTEVLVSAGKLEKEDLSTKISKLSRRVDEVKGEVFDLVAKKFETFSPTLVSSEALAAQVQGVCNDLDSLRDRVQQQVRREAHNAITEFSSLREQLESTNAVLCTLKQLHKVYQCLEGSREALGAHKYLLSARRLLNGQRATLRLQEDLGRDVRLLEAVQSELVTQRENLINHLNDEWRQRVVWAVPTGKEQPSVEQCLHTQLRLLGPPGITRDESKGREPPPSSSSSPFVVSTTTTATSSSPPSSLAAILAAYAALGLLHKKLRRFVELLHSFVLRPLVVFPGLAVSAADGTLSLVSSSTSSSVSSSTSLDPARTFAALLQALTFVHQHMLAVPPNEPVLVSNGDGDRDDDDDDDGGDDVGGDGDGDSGDGGDGGVASVMGSLLWEPLCETLIQHCLLASVPSDSAGLQAYTEVIDATGSFERSLLSLGLLSNESTALLSYARDVNAHFSGKKCRDGVTRARSLMTAPLHDTVKVSDVLDVVFAGPSAEAVATVVGGVPGGGGGGGEARCPGRGGGGGEGAVRREAHNAITEFSSLREQLESTNAVLCTLKQLHKVYQCLEGSREALGAHKYLLSARRLLNGQRATLRLQEDLGRDVRLLEAVQSELVTQRENLINHLNDEWRQRVVWAVPTGKEQPSVEQCLHTQLRLLGPPGITRDESKGREPPPSSSSSSPFVVSTTTAATSSSPPSSLAAILAAYAALGLLHKKLRRFVEALHSFVLRPLVVFPGLAVSATDGTLSLVSSSTTSSVSSSTSSDPARTFAALLQALTFVHQHMLAVPPNEPVLVSNGDGDRDDDDDDDGGDDGGGDSDSGDGGDGGVASVMGSLLWEPLCETLIQHCLLASVPSDSAGLQAYTEVIDATGSFERSLLSLGLLSNESTALLSYARDVNAHFSGKKCRDGVTRARSLMTAPLHDTVKVSDVLDVVFAGPSAEAVATVGGGVPAAVAAAVRRGVPAEGAVAVRRGVSAEGAVAVRRGVPAEGAGGPGLSPATLRMPRCRISRSARDLVLLAHGILTEACSSQGPCAAQLFYAVRNIFHLFCDVVPTYHRESLQNFPQVAAIHHNNCMLLAHYLLTLGHQYHARLPFSLSEGTTTFVDLVPAFRKLGAEALLGQLRSQKAVLHESLGVARGFRSLEDDGNYAAAQRSVKQVLHQLSRLGVVWQGVLPVNVYCKALGTLLNTALTEITAAVAALEDISALDADRLHALCSEVATSAPAAFRPWSEEEEEEGGEEGGEEERAREEEERGLRLRLPLHVAAWGRFAELRGLLQGTLSDIVDRWADGKGPLAQEFSPSEVKSLVRALFQNTDRRAAALNKIK